MYPPLKYLGWADARVEAGRVRRAHFPRPSPLCRSGWLFWLPVSVQNERNRYKSNRLDDNLQTNRTEQLICCAVDRPANLSKVINNQSSRRWANKLIQPTAPSTDGSVSLLDRLVDPNIDFWFDTSVDLLINRQAVDWSNWSIGFPPN